MIPRKPYIFATGETVSLRKFMDNFHRSIKDLTYCASRVVTRSHFIVDWSGTTNAHTQQEREYQFTVPGNSTNVLIYAMEIQVTGNAVDGYVSINRSTGELGRVTCLAADGAGKRYRALIQTNIIYGGSAIDLYPIVSAVNLTQSIRVTFYYKTVRKPTERFSIYLPMLVREQTMSLAATAFDGAITGLAGEVTSDDAANRDLRMEVFAIREDAASPLNNEQFFIPAEGRRVESMNLTFCGPVGTTLRARLINTAGAGVTIKTCSCAGAGTGTKVANADTASVPVEASTLSTTLSENMQLILDRTAGAGTIVSAFVTIYYI